MTGFNNSHRPIITAKSTNPTTNVRSFGRSIDQWSSSGRSQFGMRACGWAVSAVEVARQLTLLQHRLFAAIDMRDVYIPPRSYQICRSNHIIVS